MARKVSLNIGKKTKEYQVIEDVYPHILVETDKEIHGWINKYRECTSERLLLNPYNGCSYDCSYCYTKGYDWGYFELFKREKVVTVFKDFHRNVAQQLEELKIASCGYLSPVSEPFSKLNKKYRLSEKIIKEFVERNIPIEFITKEVVPLEVIELLKNQKHSFGQISILTLREKLRLRLMKEGAEVKDLFKNIRTLAKNNIFAVCRIDPVLPFINDNKEELEEIVIRAKDEGASHIITSCLDIPKSFYGEFLDYIKNFGVSIYYDYKRLYKEVIANSFHADINYRKSLFDRLRNICDKHNISFALCMEFELKGREVIGLNNEFKSSLNCEGIDVPLYRKYGKHFEPISNCSGDCLNCRSPNCGIEELSKGNNEGLRIWKLSDYKRWSKKINEEFSLFQEKDRRSLSKI